MKWSRDRASRPVPPDADCREVARVLQSFLDGELGPEDGETVAAHLAVCEHCNIESATIDAVRDTIRAQRPDLDVDDLSRLEAFVADIDRHAR